MLQFSFSLVPGEIGLWLKQIRRSFEHIYGPQAVYSGAERQTLVGRLCLQDPGPNLALGENTVISLSNACDVTELS